jgi:serine/threonine protein kinase
VLGIIIHSFFLYVLFLQARVLKFLSEKRISHMDLKPENILLTSIDRPVLKVAGMIRFSWFLSD